MQSSVEVLSPSTIHPIHNGIGPRSPTHPFDFESDDEVEDEKINVDRAASYTDLPKLIEQSPDGGIKRTFSENVLAVPSETIKSSTNVTYTPNKELLRRASQKQKNSKPPERRSSRFSLGSGNPTPQAPPASAPTQVVVEPTSPEKKSKGQEKTQSRSVSGTIRGFVRKSWISPSSKSAPNAEKNTKDKDVRTLDRVLNRLPSKQKLEPKADLKAGQKAEQKAEPKPQHNVDQVTEKMLGQNVEQQIEHKLEPNPPPKPEQPLERISEQTVPEKSEQKNEQKPTQSSIESKPIESATTGGRFTRSKSRTPSPVKKIADEASKKDKYESPPQRRTTLLSRGRRPLSAIIGSTRSESDPVIRKTPSLRSLKSIPSLDRLSAPAVPQFDAPPVPPVVLSEKLDRSSIESSKRGKDPLWGVFRTLEGDYQKFHSKSSALKANVIRTSLLPFLSRYASHSSVYVLRVEDLDRRVMILNKWWTGLMDMLNGKNNQPSVSGTDRPVFLEAVTGIMTRPEWRIPPLISSPNFTDLPAPPRISYPSRSTTSLESNASDFLTESIHNNIRSLFSDNLMSQMAFVVEKMSLKTAPASLVNFCGKVCGYAFFFCPGVADILTRLWTVLPETSRRILSECGISRGANLHAKSQEIAAYFPGCVRGLSFDTHAGLCRRLRQHPSLPKTPSVIRWFGPWINRWTGRESDLFFAFTKQYHILISEFLPNPIEPKDRPCIPGLVLVHGQILTVLEATLYRQAHAGQEALDHLSNSLFDEMEGPDASAATMPLTAANAIRSMAENRLIMLLRDLLSDKSPEHNLVRQFYAASFDNIIKAATRKMSVYDNSACFVLCDFMEEVFVITSRYQQETQDFELFDWAFWFEVFRKMMDCHNALTEVRLLAFIYNTWNTIIDNAHRRKDVCLRWLLEPAFFTRFFNHWSPMVRGFFYRLLCWRVSRLEEEDVPEVKELLATLKCRLNEVWAQYLYLRDDAEARNVLSPSTAPCTPAPGRRLVILRIDTHPIQPNLFMSFDNPQSRKGQNQISPYGNHSSLMNGIPGLEDTQSSQNRKRWSLKSIVPFNGPANTRPGEVTPPGSASDDSSINGDSLKGMPPRFHETDGTLTPSHQPFSFKFSLEWLNQPSWQSRNRLLSSPKLPQPALLTLEGFLDVENHAKINPTKPKPEDLSNSRYSGRALAEWAQVVSECNSFFDRRKDEGVPTNRLVETPTLSVESFRMLG